MDISNPEPPPKNEGINIPSVLITWLKFRSGSEDAVKLIESRDRYGLEKYGQHLMSKDGRNDIIDAKQELGDLMQYVMKAKINKKNLSEIRKLSKFYIELLYPKVELRCIVCGTDLTECGYVEECDDYWCNDCWPKS